MKGMSKSLEKNFEIVKEEMIRTKKLNEELEITLKKWREEIKKLRDMQVEYQVIISQLKMLKRGIRNEVH